jgi:branched-subunit amino acid ABC-type transport system permease component
MRTAPPRALQVGLIVAILALGIGLAQTQHKWPFVVTGIADGSIYSLAALGLVLTFKTSGIFNFAIGAQAAASAYLFYTFRIDAGMPWPIAGLLAMLIAGVGGSLILERLAFTLSSAPAVMTVVATIGLIVLLASMLTGIYGSATLAFPQYLPSESVTIGGVTVLVSQIIVALLALAATIGLYVFFRRNRIGIAMQALVDDPDLLASQGTSPIAVRRYAWAIGSCFVSMSGMLIAPTLGIDVNTMLLLYITAFGAAAVGAFDNLIVTFLTAIAIGIATNVIGDSLATQHDPFLRSFYTQVPFIALVAALLFVPRARLVERGRGRVRKPAPITRVPRPLLLPLGVVAATVAVVLPHAVSGADVSAYTVALGFGMVLLSLGLLVWSSGQISLCQMAFAAVGASTMAHALDAGFPWLLALLMAGLVALPVGALVAIPSFRLSGVYLAVATFGFGLLFQNLVYNTRFMFSVNGSVQIHRPRLFGMDTTSDLRFYYVTLVFTALAAALVLLVRRSRLGRILRALGDSPSGLAAHGVNTKRTCLAVFCLSAFISAIGGALIGTAILGAGSDPGGPFGYFNSLALVAVLAFCGRRPIASPALAAFLFTVLKIYPPFDSEFAIKYQGVAFGALAIAVAVLPQIELPRLRGRGAGRRERTPVTARREQAALGATT